MPWTTPLLLTLAFLSWRFALQHPDDVGRFLGSLSTLVFGLAGLATAPLFLQGILLVGLLVYPICTTQPNRQVTAHCPQLCLLRSQCHPPS